MEAGGKCHILVDVHSIKKPVGTAACKFSRWLPRAHGHEQEFPPQFSWPGEENT